jgi:hypothetical protein
MIARGEGPKLFYSPRVGRNGEKVRWLICADASGLTLTKELGVLPRPNAPGIIALEFVQLAILASGNIAQADSICSLIGGRIWISVLAYVCDLAPVGGPRKPLYRSAAAAA